MSKAERLSHETADITDENIEKIGALFPNCITEAKDEQGRLRKAIDFDKLRQELSHEVVEGADERYRFDWPEKRKATLLANTPTNMTLRPCREESVNFDTTQNLYIEGDNLEVLKLLRENYYKQVKMIYIDPPYNTGNDSFLYDDDYSVTSDEFSEESSATDYEGQKVFNLRQNNESNGRFHTDWLNMLYPRLKVAKDLLADDGVIFISIDGHEEHNLRKICDEIFGEKNLITKFVWEKGKEGGNDSDDMRSHYEEILLYCRDQGAENKFNLDAKDISRHIVADKEPNLVKGIIALQNEGELFQLINLSKQKDYTVNIPLIDGTIINWPSYAPQTSIDEWIKIGKIFVGAKRVPYVKSYLKDELQGQRPSNIIKQEYGTTKAGTIELRDLLGGSDVFPYPKPSVLLQRLVGIGSREDSIIVDFFSGSATMANAIMRTNQKNRGSSRRYILVQLPEDLDKALTTASAKRRKIIQNAINFLDEVNAKHTICEIGKERIRRAGKKILEEWNETLVVENTKAKHEGELLSLPGLDANGETIEINVGAHMANKQTPPDVGFRVLKLDSSNMKDVYYNPKKFEEEFVFHDSDASLAENIKPDRTGEDLLFDTMLRLGIPLSAKIAAEEIHGKKVFTVDDGLLMATFDNDLNEEAIAAIAKRKPIYFAMSDGGFATDNVADNFEQIWQEFSPDTKRKVI